MPESEIRRDEGASVVHVADQPRLATPFVGAVKATAVGPFLAPHSARAGVLTALAAAVLLSSCSGTVAETTTTGSSPAQANSVGELESPPELDPNLVSTGSELYARFCAECHGADLRGAENWRVMNEDGSLPPPPQNSEGHTWHHGDDLLVDLILNGSGFPQSRMPAFGDRLSESDVLAILEYLKSSWGPEERAVQWDVTLREGA